MHTPSPTTTTTHTHTRVPFHTHALLLQLVPMLMAICQKCFVQKTRNVVQYWSGNFYFLFSCLTVPPVRSRSRLKSSVCKAMGASDRYWCVCSHVCARACVCVCVCVCACVRAHVAEYPQHQSFFLAPASTRSNHTPVPTTVNSGLPSYLHVDTARGTSSNLKNSTAAFDPMRINLNVNETYQPGAGSQSGVDYRGFQNDTLDQVPSSTFETGSNSPVFASPVPVASTVPVFQAEQQPTWQQTRSSAGATGADSADDVYDNMDQSGNAQENAELQASRLLHARWRCRHPTCYVSTGEREGVNRVTMGGCGWWVRARECTRCTWVHARACVQLHLRTCVYVRVACVCESGMHQMSIQGEALASVATYVTTGRLAHHAMPYHTIPCMSGVHSTRRRPWPLC